MDLDGFEEGVFLVPFPDQPFVGLDEEFAGRFLQGLPADDAPYFFAGDHELLGDLPMAESFHLVKLADLLGHC
jgi:hypothetical protein